MEEMPAHLDNISYPSMALICVKYGSYSSALSFSYFRKKSTCLLVDQFHREQ